jgi:membrane carboxypeptidase/penicillin-binding protein
MITLRAALENSKNLATVNLLNGGIAADASASLDKICALAVELQIYKECARYYPFVLGAQPVRPIDLAVFYATIANEGMRPSPHAIDAIEQNGNIVYRHSPSLSETHSADRASFYQLKTMLQGVLQRGTARQIASLAPYVVGKTGTTDDENDAWFVGFSNDVTVTIWVGYDNADGRRRTLGSGRTGSSVAVPIFEPIMQAVWAHHAPKAFLDPPSPEAKILLVAANADRRSRDNAKRGALAEYLRRDASGRPVDARYDLTSRKEASDKANRRSRRQYTNPQAPAGPDASPEPQPWGWGAWGWQERNEGPRSQPYDRRDDAPFVLQRY